MAKNPRTARHRRSPATRIRSPRSSARDAVPPAEPATTPPAGTRSSVASWLAGKLIRYDAESELRSKVQGFIFHARFGSDFDRAMGQYFGRAAVRRRTLVMDEGETPGLQEWYVNDYRTRGGKRLIDLFAEEIGPTLPPAEAGLLTAWRRMNHVRLLEVQAVISGSGVVVQDLLSGETMTVSDRSAARNLERWWTLLARPHQAVDRVCFTGAMMALPPTFKADILDSARALWASYQTTDPENGLAGFYRHHGLDLTKAFRRLSEEAERPPAVLSAEGHPVVASRAEYRLRDPTAVARALAGTEEFVNTGTLESHPEALHLVWLHRGRSSVPAAATRPRHALALQGEWASGPGEPLYRTLGDVEIWPDRLVLETLSRERLRAGKALVSEVLGTLIQHRRDSFTTLESMLEKADRGGADARRPPAKPGRAEVAALRDLAGRHTRAWLDTSLEALDGLSPREAVKHPDGRAEVIELLKVMEYYESAKRQAGEPAAMDLALIRRELGLPE